MQKGYSVDTFILYRRAHVAICRAELAPSTARVAHELLAMVDLDNGQINMTWETLALMTGCENVNAARRHLSRLAAAKLVHYSTNDYVYVTWLMWMEDCDQSARSRATTSAPARQSDEAVDHEIALFGEVDAPLSARQRANRRVDALEPARGRAAHSHARLLVSQSVDPLASNSDDRLTDRQTPDNGPDSESPVIDLDERHRSMLLLTDGEVGLDEAAAWRFARRYSFEYLVRQVMTYRRQLAAGIVHGPGALVKRLTEGYGGACTEDDRKSDLFRRHNPNWREQEPKRNYCPAEYADIILH